MLYAFLAAVVVKAQVNITCGPGSSYPKSPSRIAESQDQFRPRYHFVAPHGWMNDPIRPTYVNGTIHLFYQYNPCGSTWGNMSWGHATSKDLLHWQDEPVALWAEQWYEAQGGIFTGSVILNESAADAPTAIAFYTGAARTPIAHNIPYDLGQETVAVAVAQDSDLRVWAKDLTNPVILQPPEALLRDGEVCVTG